MRFSYKKQTMDADGLITSECYYFMYNTSWFFYKTEQSVTWQNLCFFGLMDAKNFHTNTPEEIIKFKEAFLRWQSKFIPSSFGLDSVYMEIEYKVKPFSHDDDMTWNSLDKWFALEENRKAEEQVFYENLMKNEVANKARNAMMTQYFIENREKDV